MKRLEVRCVWKGERVRNVLPHDYYPDMKICKICEGCDFECTDYFPDNEISNGLIRLIKLNIKQDRENAKNEK